MGKSPMMQKFKKYFTIESAFKRLSQEAEENLLNFLVNDQLR